MASISSAGIGSGLDVNSIVTQLMSIERQPLNALQTKATAIQSTVSEYGKVKSAISTLRDAASKLSGSSLWGQTVSTSSNAAAVTSTTNGSVAGTYAVAVQSLASVQTVATGVYPTTTSTPGSGVLTIDMGAWGAGQTSFTGKTPAVSANINIAATDTLTDVRDKINAAGVGVTALIMTDSSGSRLLMRSNVSGAENGFRTSGVAGLGFNPPGGAAGMTQTQAAADAKATVNGLPVTSTTNSFVNIVDGLSLTLNAVTTAPVNVDVAADKDNLKKAVTAFAEAYSAVMKLISTDTKYDPVTKKGGPLLADSAVSTMQTQMRALVSEVSGASAVFGHLSDVGLQIQTDGSLTVNAAKLDSALVNLPELKKAFSNSDALNSANNGFAKKFKALNDTMLASDGSLANRTDGLSTQITRNQKSQDDMNIRLAGIEKRLRAQYNALDARMGQLTGKSGLVSQQIAAYNRGG
jgi:flagellar hook-associated protein 2